jgi:6-phosphofructokinase 1
VPEVTLDFSIDRLGDCRFASPVNAVQFIDDDDLVLFDGSLHATLRAVNRGERPPALERAGPRRWLYFDPAWLKCGIVTCGGICPGLNDVIRAVVLSLYYQYDVKEVYGFRYGYEGLNPAFGHTPMPLTPERVESISSLGGTFLGTSRGNQDVGIMVDTLERLGIGILFTVGGDGTLRGAAALAQEIKRRGRQIAVVAIPKTIDNDIAYIQESFGFHTAASEAYKAVEAAHTEATSARNGIGLVKLMGRESGFIAAYTALADSRVNFCLVPEAPFTLEALLAALQVRLAERSHAVIAVAEGAGQALFAATGERDASGNVVFGDIGLLLRDQIKAYFKAACVDINLKYIDPSYLIRSVPANAYDSAFCLILGQNAVHAGMAGCTSLVVGNWRGNQTHVPIAMAVSHRKKIDPTGPFWNSVLASTGQPHPLR